VLLFAYNARMDDQGTTRTGRIVSLFIKSSPRDRVVAGILTLVYAALWALALYLQSIRIEDYWPKWALWAGGLGGMAVMIVLPLLAVRYFFGIQLDSLWQFSLRKMLIGVVWISVFFWFMTQMQWSVERSQWLISNRAAARSTQGDAPFGLRLLGKPGESRIEIKNGTKEQLAEAKRLFPEATVVVIGKE